MGGEEVVDPGRCQSGIQAQSQRYLHTRIRCASGFSLEAVRSGILEVFVYAGGVRLENQSHRQLFMTMTLMVCRRETMTSGVLSPNPGCD